MTARTLSAQPCASQDCGQDRLRFQAVPTLLVPLPEDRLYLPSERAGGLGGRVSAWWWKWHHGQQVCTCPLAVPGSGRRGRAPPSQRNVPGAEATRRLRAGLRHVGCTRRAPPGHPLSPAHATGQAPLWPGRPRLPCLSSFTTVAPRGQAPSPIDSLCQRTVTFYNYRLSAASRCFDVEAKVPV